MATETSETKFTRSVRTGRDPRSRRLPIRRDASRVAHPRPSPARARPVRTSKTQKKNRIRTFSFAPLTAATGLTAAARFATVALVFFATAIGARATAEVTAYIFSAVCESSCGASMASRVRAFVCKVG